jgi:hypothetical protein
VREMPVQIIKTRRPWAWCCIALLAAVSFVIFRHNTALYPYYSTDDMDQVTALDALLIQGGMLHDQVTHPAGGMYLMLSWSQWFGRLVGLVHMRDYTAMYSWANPLLGVAELTQFLRGHLPFLAVGSALLLAFALAKVTRAGSLLLILAFLFFAGSRSFAYQTILFRTDLFALFYASCSLYVALIAVDANRALRSSVLAVASGMFAGLAFNTKIQILPTIAAVPLFALLMMLRDSSLSAFGRLSPRSNRIIAGVSVSLYVAFVVLAFFLDLPAHVYHSRTSFSITPLCIVTGLALIIPMLLTEFFKKPESLGYRFGSFANLMGLGFLLSIPLLMLVFSDLRMGAFYALSIVKVVFLGSVDPILVGNPASLWQQFTSTPLLFLLPAVMVGALAVSQRRSSNYGELAVLGVIFLLFVLSVIVFNRGMQGHDIVFSEPLSLFLSLVLLQALWKRGVALRRATVAFSALLALQVAINGQPAPFINAQLAGYFRETKQLTTSYGRGNQGVFEGYFTRLFVQDDDGRRIPVASRDAIFEQAANFDTIASQVEFSLPNLRVDRSRIGVVAEGLKPYGQQRPETRFTKVGDTLRGATSYIPRAADAVPGAVGLGRLLTFLGVNWLERDALLHTRPEMILTRSDLSVFVLVPAAIKDEFGWSEAPAEVGIGGETYVAVPVPAYPPAALLAKLAAVNDRIIVIKRKHA